MMGAKMLTNPKTLSKNEATSLGYYAPPMTWLKRPEPIGKSRRRKLARPSRQSATDRADAADADRILNDPNEKLVDYTQARKKLGLA